MNITALANCVYEGQNVEPGILEELKQAQIASIFNLCTQVSDLFAKELVSKAGSEALLEAIKTKSESDKVLGLKFNQAINTIYRVLNKREKNIISFIMFDYLHRKTAVQAFITAEEQTEYAQGASLLTHEYYRKLTINRLDNPGRPSMTELKQYLSKSIFSADGEELENLKFQAMREGAGAEESHEYKGYKQAFCDGISRTYTLNLAEYQLARVDAQEPAIGVHSFYVDTYAYIFEGKVVIPLEPYKNYECSAKKTKNSI